MKQIYFLGLKDGRAYIENVTGTQAPTPHGVMMQFPESGADSDVLVITKDFITVYGKKFAADLRDKNEQPEPRIRYGIGWRNFDAIWCRVFHWPKWYVYGDPMDEKSTALLRCAKCQLDRVGITREVI